MSGEKVDAKILRSVEDYYRDFYDGKTVDENGNRIEHVHVWRPIYGRIQDSNSEVTDEPIGSGE